MKNKYEVIVGNIGTIVSVMNNFIIIDKTFVETTPESCEHADFSNKGFVSENERVSFRELVDLMRDHYQPSQSPHAGETDVWFSTGFYTKDYAQGIDRQESIHYSPLNTANAAKYWRLAARMALKKSILID